MKRTATLGTALSLALGVPALAHHGTSQYAMDREITLHGTVTDWRWVHPHARLHVRIEGSDESWAIEGAPLRWMQERGWSADTLTRGEPVTVTLHPLRSGEDGGLLKDVTREDGERLEVQRPRRFGGR